MRSNIFEKTKLISFNQSLMTVFRVILKCTRSESQKESRCQKMRREMFLTSALLSRNPLLPKLQSFCAAEVLVCFVIKSLNSQ